MAEVHETTRSFAQSCTTWLSACLLTSAVAARSTLEAVASTPVAQAILPEDLELVGWRCTESSLTP